MKKLKLFTMKMMPLILGLFMMNMASAQIEEELGFVYVKADYMIETERFQEAAAELSAIIDVDPSYEEVLLKRANCYYNLGNYKNAQSDILESIAVRGIDGETVKLHGMIASALNNFKAAENSLGLAIQFNYRDAEVQYAMAENYKNAQMFTEACEYWENAASLGSDRARLQMNKYCRGLSRGAPMNTNPNASKNGSVKIKVPNNTRINTSKTPTDQDDDLTIMDDGVILHHDNPVEPEVQYVEPEPQIDDTVKDVPVDEDLSLTIKNGIGSRKILKQPDILILSEASGSVAVDICINSRGKVESSAFNKEESTLDAQSLISLAERKSMDFWFEKHDDKEMCGTIIFNVNPE